MYLAKTKMDFLKNRIRMIKNSGEYNAIQYGKLLTNSPQPHV